MTCFLLTPQPAVWGLWSTFKWWGTCWEWTRISAFVGTLPNWTPILKCELWSAKSPISTQAHFFAALKRSRSLMYGRWIFWALATKTLLISRRFSWCNWRALSIWSHFGANWSWEFACVMKRGPVIFRQALPGKIGLIDWKSCWKSYELMPIYFRWLNGRMWLSLMALTWKRTLKGMSLDKFYKVEAPQKILSLQKNYSARWEHSLSICNKQSFLMQSIQSIVFFSFNNLIINQTSETAVTFIYLPPPPLDDNDIASYYNSLEVLSRNLPPTIYVHGVSPVTSTTL